MKPQYRILIDGTLLGPALFAANAKQWVCLLEELFPTASITVISLECARKLTK